MTSFQVLHLLHVDTDISYNLIQLWQYKFMTTPWDGTTYSVGQTLKIYSIGSLQEFVTQVNDNYQKMRHNEQNFEDIDVHWNDAEHPRNVRMVSYGFGKHGERESEVHIFANGDLGPISYPTEELKVWLHNTRSFSLGWTLYVRYPDDLTINAHCNAWMFNQNYDFKARAIIEVRLSWIRQACGPEHQADFVKHTEDTMAWVAVICLILSAASFV